MGRMSDLWIEMHNEEIDRMNATQPAPTEDPADLIAILERLTPAQRRSAAAPAPAP